MTIPTEDPGAARTRALALLAEFNRREFQDFDEVRGGVMGCAASAVILAVVLTVTVLLAGWNWWLLAGGAVAAVLIWITSKVLERRTYREMAGRMQAFLSQRGVEVEEGALREAVLARPEAVVVSYREVGFLYRMLRALAVSDEQASEIVDAVEAARTSRRAALHAEGEGEGVE